MAGSTGLEPAASGVTGRRYNRLNYDPETKIAEKGLSAVLPSPFIIPTYFDVRLIPQGFGRLASKPF